MSRYSQLRKLSTNTNGAPCLTLRTEKRSTRIDVAARINGAAYSPSFGVKKYGPIGAVEKAIAALEAFTGHAYPMSPRQAWGRLSKGVEP